MNHIFNRQPDKLALLRRRIEARMRAPRRETIAGKQAADATASVTLPAATHLSSGSVP